jgi:ParB/RepB/Spo0J family partition protein
MSKSALDEKRMNGWWVDPAHLTIIGVDTEDGPEHVLYDERNFIPLDSRFIDQIKAYGGIHTPISVRKVGDRIEVVAGRRRVRAARAINAETPGALLVPCVRVAGDNSRAQDVAASENAQREADTVEVSAKKVVRYIASGRTIHEAALHFNVSDQTIRNWLAFAEAPAAVKAEAKSATQVFRPKKATPAKKIVKSLTKDGALIALEGEPGFEDGFRAALRWMLGDTLTSEIAGLERCISAHEREKQSRETDSDDRATEGEEAPSTAGEGEAAIH